MQEGPRLSQLQPAQRKLVRLMHEMGFGRIEGLVVQSGLPVFRPAPRVVREIKLEPDTAPVEPAAGDYIVKHQVSRLLDRMRELGDGRIETLVVANGLPMRLSIESEAYERAEKLSR